MTGGLRGLVGSHSLVETETRAHGVPCGPQVPTMDGRAGAAKVIFVLGYLVLPNPHAAPT
jgi:hypothetical protein